MEEKGVELDIEEREAESEPEEDEEEYDSYCEDCDKELYEEDISSAGYREFEEVLCNECYFERQGFPITEGYHRIDGWRGHTTFDPKDPNRVVKAVEYCIVPHDQNSAIINALTEQLEEWGFEVLVTSTHTSNVFSEDLMVFAKKPDDEVLTEKEKEALVKARALFGDVYNWAFSVFSGETYPINMEEFNRGLAEINVGGEINA